jgi:hypothetical protein
MTTLAANKPRAFEGGNRNSFPVIAADIIYEGAAVGLVDGTGHARPLAAGDRFAGFAERKADNSAGAPRPSTSASSRAARSSSRHRRGDHRRRPAGLCHRRRHLRLLAGRRRLRRLRAPLRLGRRRRSSRSTRRSFRDPVARYTVRETISANKTLDAEDTGKLFWVDTDAKSSSPCRRSPPASTAA